MVGPNGSGKSNLADALRWILGERSFALPRWRRSDDMIFSGKEGHHTSETPDLQAARYSLRQLIAELDGSMESRFVNTFEAVAAQFAEYLTLLFEGGEAELVLMQPGDSSQTGLHVRVCPPGRREQSLALLSRGERVLTAVALIFAIVTVRCTPFCLLDEVDAMLDQANSGRFRHLLEKLAERTQFIVITHKRQVIEAADTIYGVSMDDGGVSQVISLHLDEVVSTIQG